MIALALLLLASPEAERMLLGPSPFFRREGMELARRAGDTELLLRAARGKAWDARRLAAEGLGGDTPFELLDDAVAVVREAAIRALDVKAPRDPLLRLLRDPDDSVRAAAAWALRDRRAGAELQKLLRDRSPAVRLAALGALGDTSRLLSLSKRPLLKESVPALAMLARAGGPSEAASLLARLSRAVKAANKLRILPYYWRDPRPDLALARAVGDLARRGVSPGGRDISVLLQKMVAANDLTGAGGVLLAEAVAGARDAEAARRILDAQLLGRRNSTQTNAHFNPALYGVLHAFAREPWPGLGPLLLPLLEDKDRNVRLGVVGALRGTHAEAGLRDTDPEVRIAALARVERVEAVERAMRDGSVHVQRACAAALGRIASPASVPLLKRLLVSDDSGVRACAVAALLRVGIGPAERVDLLLGAALRDRDPIVRAPAAAVLSLLDDPSALGRAIAALADASEQVRRNAIALVHALTPARLDYDAAKPGPGAAAWTAWWEQRKSRVRAPDAFRYHVEDLRRRGLDLVLAIDATGSMASIIQATKRRIEAVMARLRDIVPNLRIRIVAYRDKGDAFLTIGSPLTHDPRVLEDFLACVPASGGGDTEEAILDGLKNAIGTTRWRNKSHRVVLLFGDAPPHERDTTLLKTLVKEFKGTVHTVHTTHVSSGAELSPTGRAFASIAEWGGGSLVHLTDENDLLRAILVLALGPSHRAAVEALFGL